MHTKFWLFCGIPAVGKTTIGRRLAEIASEHIVYVSAGEEKRRILKNIKTRRSRLSQLDQSDSIKVNKAFFQKIYKDYILYGKNVLIDTHASYQDFDYNDAFIRLTPPGVVIDGIILLYNHPITIVERRIDRGRDRDSVSVDHVWREYYAELFEVKAIAEEWRVPYITIDSQLSVAVICAEIAAWVTSTAAGRTHDLHTKICSPV